MRKFRWMSRLPQLPPQFPIAAALAAAAVVMAFAGWTLHGAMQAARSANAMVMQSQQVLQALSRLREGYARIAAAQPGYLLDGAERSLQERERAIGLSKAALDSLHRLTQARPAQAARTRRLDELVTERAEVARAVAGRITKPALSLPFTPEELAWLGEIEDNFLSVVRAMESEESQMLASRQAIEFERQRHTSLVLIGAFASFAALALLAFAGVVVESRRRHHMERQTSELVENLPVTAWQMKSMPDGSRRFVYVAGSALRERGLRPEDLLRDRSLAMASVHPDDRARVAEALLHSEQTLQPLDCSYRMVPQPGSRKVRWMHTHARMRRLRDGSLLWTGYWSDITHQKGMELALREATDEARRASRAKSTFLATMSHEIRTPLTAVMGLLELLFLTRLDEDQRATLGVVRESSQSLLRIIDDILDFSKVEEGRLALAPAPASLRESVRRACEVHSGIASARGLLLERWVDPRVGEAHLFDPLRLGQILNNFISNAIKFTEHGRVQVKLELLEARAGAQHLRLSVTDTGVGVPPGRIAQLFQPFEQGAPQISSTYGGTGLGLAICRRLAALMDGRVDMESTPGRGTRVSFQATFPLADASTVKDTGAVATGRRLQAAMADRRAPPTADAAESEGTLVLVVDDHPTNRLVLSRQVATLGYGVVVAEDGAEALALWRTRRIGLVLTDSNMPQMNGYELARAIRQEETARGGARVPIVACTANAAPGEAVRCEAAGMDGCLVKPVDLATLLEQLHQLLPLPGSQGGFVPPPGFAEAQDSKFDAGLVALISGGEREEERRILEGYLRTNAEDLEAMEQAVEAHDTAEVARLAHRVKGAAQTLGAQALLRACHELEENALVEEPRSTLRGNLQDVLARSVDLERRLRSRMSTPRS